MPVVFDIQGLLDGTKTALLAPATRSDQALIDGEVVTLDAVPLRAPVQQVQHFGRHASTVGEPIAARSVSTGSQYDALITALYLIRSDDLTPEELGALGYEDRSDFDAEWGDKLKHRRAWFIRIMPHSDSSTH